MKALTTLLLTTYTGLEIFSQNIERPNFVWYMTTAQTKDEIKKALHSEDDVTRYWAATVCASYGEKADIFRKDLEKLLSDNHPFVASRALAALNNFSKQDNVAIIKKLLKQAKSGPESLSVLNEAAYIKWKTGNNINISMSDIVKPATSIEWRINYLTGNPQL